MALPKLTKRVKVVSGTVLVIVLAVIAWRNRPIHVEIALDGPTAEWPSYGNDRGGSRHSPLTQITPENVQHLKIAWEYHHGDVSDGKGEIPSTTAFEATPIMVRGTLYFPTPFNRVIALDPETGEEKWTYDPKMDLNGRFANQLIARGVEYWEDASDASAPGSRRIFTTTNDSRLIALDAQSGLPCQDFGTGGEIDLGEGPGPKDWYGEYHITSPPAIAGDVVVVGSAISDNARVDAPSGVVRAYHARTGDLIWAWDLAPPDKDEKDYPTSEAGYVLGTPNVWAPIAVDVERDLVFLPTGNASPDYFAASRNGLDYYSSSVVALRGATGEVVWNFQTVHHDLWDFDVPCQPTLTHITRDGKKIPVVVQATKMGLIFVLHRETGEPIFEVEERPAPQGDTPGEIYSPTQPIPVKPPQLVGRDFEPEDAWSLTPFGKRGVRERVEALHFEGMYTPPRVNVPTLMYPGNAGGSNWGGIAIEGEREILVANTMDLAWVVSLIPADEIEEAKKNNPGVEIGTQKGAPYGMRRETLLSGLGLPINPPPWGTLAAVDLQKGDIMWQVKLGTVRDIAPVPLPLKFGVPNLGGPLVTGSGLIFIAAALDDYLRAFDLMTGEEIWKARLPAGGQATPMTYRVNETGKQYVVIAAGGHGRAGSKLGDSLVAFALPGKPGA